MWINGSTYKNIHAKAQRIIKDLVGQNLINEDYSIKANNNIHARARLIDSNNAERNFLFKLRPGQTQTQANPYLGIMNLPNDIVATTDGYYQVFFDFSKGLEEFTKALTTLFRLVPKQSFPGKISNPSVEQLDKILRDGDKNLMTTEGTYYKLSNNTPTPVQFPLSYDYSEISEQIKKLKSDIYLWLVRNDTNGHQDFTLTEDNILFQVTKTQESNGNFTISIQSDSNNPIKIQFDPISITTQNYMKLNNLISKALDLLFKKLGPSDFFDINGNKIELNRDSKNKISTQPYERLFTEEGSIPVDLQNPDVNIEYFVQRKNQ